MFQTRELVGAVTTADAVTAKLDPFRTRRSISLIFLSFPSGNGKHE